MSATIKIPDWFNFHMQPLFYAPKPTPISVVERQIKSQNFDGKCDHVVYEDDKTRVVADISGNDDWGFELEVRTYEKTSTHVKDYETALKKWEDDHAAYTQRLEEWKELRKVEEEKIRLNRDHAEYLRLKKIFDGKPK